MIKVSRLLIATGRIEQSYPREQIVEALEEYILENLNETTPLPSFREHITQNFGKAYHLLEDFILDDGLWTAAINGLKTKKKIQEIPAISPTHTGMLRKLNA